MPPQPPSQPGPRSVDILTGATLWSEPGEGAGLFVEYLGDGTWYVWSTCDSAISGLSCDFRFIATPEVGASITSAALDPPDEDASNQVSTTGDSLTGHFMTRLEMDGTTFQVDPPGAAVQIALWTDGVADPQLFYWQGPNTIHYGAPSDPVVFVPTAP